MIRILFQWPRATDGAKPWPCDLEVLAREFVEERCVDRWTILAGLLPNGRWHCSAVWDAERTGWAVSISGERRPNPQTVFQRVHITDHPMPDDVAAFLAGSTPIPHEVPA